MSVYLAADTQEMSWDDVQIFIAGYATWNVDKAGLIQAILLYKNWRAILYQVM